MDTPKPASVINIALVGGGAQCAEILQKTTSVYEREEIYAPIIAVADSDPESPGMREAERLEAIRDEHRETRREREHRIQVRDTGISLLESASRERSHRFNKEVRSLAGRALPSFTEDRYQHLQIDEYLSVRVFSNDKHDFMDFDEISSGTQRQIMLAVRLALSQELIHSTVGGAQFVFLDEPFAFFDEPRTLNTLHALPQLSDELAQIWIITQQLPEAARVDEHIRCSRDTENLRVMASVPD